MSTEDKIAAIRQEVEERAAALREGGAIPALELVVGDRPGVVIYGVPLQEDELTALRTLCRYGKDCPPGQHSGRFATIWEMLERGKP